MEEIQDNPTLSPDSGGFAPEPGEKAEPEGTSEPEVTAEPDETPEPEVKEEPEETAEPDETAEPEVKEEPEEASETGETQEPAENLDAVLEAVLFAMGNSVELTRLADTIGESREKTLARIHGMMERYEKEDRGIRIMQLEDSFQLCTKKEYYDYLIRIAMHPAKPVLTDVMLETLSIIAYKQPVTKAEIEKIRGVNSSHAVNRLVEYDLVRELGRLDAPGRPILFGTTEAFLRTFGVEAIGELPEIDPVRLADFKAEAEEEVRMEV